MKNGTLVISLDLEMRWGILESYSELSSYRPNILGVEKSVFSILKVFEKYNIHATWATVGALLCKNLEEFEEYCPSVRPKFHNMEFSSYSYLDEVMKEKDQFFNDSIIDRIVSNPNQELACHTFSHLFTQEKGVTDQDFDSDLNSFSEIYWDKLGGAPSSFVFPRNQINFLQILKKNNYEVYRGHNVEWFYNTNNRLAKLLRLYTLHFGSKRHGITEVFYNSGMVNIPGTIFLRPYDNTLLTAIRIRRIKKILKCAKAENKIVHLWWHPHNFGINVEKNIEMLDAILAYAHKQGIKSANMKEVGISYKNSATLKK